jgi:hypothetical protein
MPLPRSMAMIGIDSRTAQPLEGAAKQLRD